MRANFLNKRSFRHFQYQNGLFAGDRRKPFEKVFETVAAFEIIEKVSYRDACSRENRGSAYLVRIDLDHAVQHIRILPQSGRQRSLADLLPAADKILLRHSFVLFAGGGFGLSDADLAL